MLVDTHCHIFNEYYDNIDDVINDAKKNNVGIIVSAGVDNKTNEELIKTSKEYPNMYICLGIHPEEADNYKDIDLDFIEKSINNPKLLAIGEIGLDYHYEGYDKEKQIILFEKQLELANKYDLPVVVHSRDATQDTINILKRYDLRGIIHSFSGSYETAQEYIKMGYKLGINGVVTFKNAHIIDVIKKIGIENFVLETDSPYLTPEPLRGKKNSPSNVKHIANFLIEQLNIDEKELIDITNSNVKEIFYKITI